MVRVEILLKTDPAVLVFALGARHVIAPVELVARDTAPRAELTVVRALPLDELFVNGAAFVPRVRHLPTLETDDSAASTFHSLLEPASLFYIVHAIGPGAPLEGRVQVNIDVHLELEVLLVDIFRAKLAHIIRLEHLTAACHHAGYLEYIAVLDVSEQVVCKAFLAILVLAPR